MDLLLHNSLTGSKEIFKPLNRFLIKMYVCGPTVYDYPHIGNARSVVTYDVLYRLLKATYGEGNVIYVRNITDVDDKIIDRAAELKITIASLTKKTSDDFHNNMAYLNCLNPTYEPKATEHIDKMIEIIERLIEFKCAYVAEGHVYFDVASAKGYYSLSGRNTEEMLHSVRIDQSLGKAQEADFVLWKPAAGGEEEGANFDSPWGRGRPGWHIECSAMSNRFLGEDFDIHGGGADLIFPHHTNEIAQSTCAYPASKFATYWVHNGFLTCNKEKMSKSLGNFITVNDFMEKGMDGDVVRLFLLSANYRKPLDFNDKALADAERQISNWSKVIQNSEIKEEQPVPDEFLSALKDDMNTPLAIKLLNDYAKFASAAVGLEDKIKYASRLAASARFIGLLDKIKDNKLSRSNEEIEQIKELVDKRKVAKQEKNWLIADQIRKDLKERFNVRLEDKPDGTTEWE